MRRKKATSSGEEGADGGWPKIMNCWSGRFCGATRRGRLRLWPVALRSIDGLIETTSPGSQAWAEALGRAGVLSEDEAHRIVAGPRRRSARMSARDPALLDQAPDEDVHSLRRARARGAHRRRRAVVCTPGARGTSRSSLDCRLYLRRRIPALQRHAASPHRRAGAPAPSAPARRSCRPTRIFAARSRSSWRTCGWRTPPRCAAITRDLDVARSTKCDVMPLGSGAIAGTSYDLDTALSRRTPRLHT